MKKSTVHDVAELALLGSYPPPYGGVTIHARRLCSLLDQKKVSYVLYNASSETEYCETVISVHANRVFWMIWYAFFGKESSVYIMSPRLMSWLLGAFMSFFRNKKVTLRIQNSRIVDWYCYSPFRKFLASLALRRMNGVVCVNSEIAQTVIRLGVAPEKVHHFPGFLPPVPADLNHQKVSIRVWKFVDGHAPIIAANGKVSIYQGVDLYGLDLLIELASRLKKDYPNVGVIFFCPDYSPEDKKYLKQLFTKADKMGVLENIYINLKSGPFLPVLKISDLFVRPTNTDGDANSIREAMYLGVPTVASDVVKRPNGVVLFKSRDIDHFEEKVRLALSKREELINQAEAIDSEMQSRIEEYLGLLTAYTKGESPAEL